MFDIFKIQGWLEQDKDLNGALVKLWGESKVVITFLTHRQSRVVCENKEGYKSYLLLLLVKKFLQNGDKSSNFLHRDLLWKKHYHIIHTPYPLST